MGLPLVATAGSATANSFASLEFAESYMEARGNAAAWTAATGEEIEIALIEGARELHNLESRYQGYRTDAVQALAFPRTGVRNTRAPVTAAIGLYTGYPEYADDEIPVLLMEANVELGFEFLKAGTTDIAAADRQRGVIRKKIEGVVETEWEPGSRPTGLSRYPRVLALLEPLFASSGSSSEVLRA